MSQNIIKLIEQLEQHLNQFYETNNYSILTSDDKQKLQQLGYKKGCSAKELEKNKNIIKKNLSKIKLYLQNKSMKFQFTEGKSSQSKIFIAHGRTTISSQFHSKDSNIFTVPKNVRIVIFEQLGQMFQKYDSCMIFNWLVQIEKQHKDIETYNLNNSKLSLGLRNTKEYYIDIYKPEQKIPNIDFYAHDNITQTGFFNLSHFAHLFEYKTEQSNSMQVQFNIKSSDNDTNKAIFKGQKIEQNPLNHDILRFKNSYTSLEKISQYLSTQDKFTTLYVISCRGLYSEKLDATGKQIKELSQHVKDTEEKYNDTKKMNDEILKYAYGREQRLDYAIEKTRESFRETESMLNDLIEKMNHSNFLFESAYKVLQNTFIYSFSNSNIRSKRHINMLEEFVKDNSQRFKTKEKMIEGFLFYFFHHCYTTQQDKVICYRLHQELIETLKYPPFSKFFT